MKKNYISSLLVIAALAVSSCSQNHLDIPKHGNMGGQDDFYVNDENINQALANMYNNVLNVSQSLLTIKNCLSDDIYNGGGTRGDNATQDQLNEYIFNTENGSIQGLYQSLYTVIYGANLIIDKVEPATDFQKQAVAEAHVIRGWAHFELGTLWGTAPIVDHLLDPSEYKQGNSEAGAILKFAIEEFKTAITSGSLRSKSSLTDKATGVRITKETALAFLGKAQLFAGDASGAAESLNKVVDSKLYELYQGEYRDLFHVGQNNCPESIFECELPYDAEKAYDHIMNYYTMAGWRTEKMDIDYSKPFAQVYVSAGWGFYNPRKSLYDAFVEMEGKDGYRKKQIIASYEELKANGFTIKPGIEVIGCEGVWTYKHQLYQSDNPVFFPYFATGAVNYRMMRYAEVLLLAAEANLGSNSKKALECINEVRKRAHLAELTTVSLDDIKKEKRLELFSEGCRFQDLVRWGDAYQAMKEQGLKVPNTLDGDGEFGTVKADASTNPTGGFKQGKNELLPFPNLEITVNPNMVQNPGW